MGAPLLLPTLVLLATAALPAQKPLFVFDGDDSTDRFGESVSGAGDVDGDGFADVIVGAPLDDNRGTDSGMARVFSGKTGATLFSADGNSAGDHFGWSVAGAGDVDGDGFADVVVGSPFDDDNGQDSGSACVLSGATGAILYFFVGDAAGDQLGWSVAGAGDVNSDGFADLIVGSPLNDANGVDAGLAQVLSGKTGQPLHTFHGAGAGDHLGWAVDGAGDADDDGFDDLVVGAPMADRNGADSGVVRVLSGQSGQILWSADGDRPGDHFGWSVSSAGDADGDSNRDVVAGAPHADSNGADAGMARVMSGVDGTELCRVDGAAAGDNLGWAVAGCEDVNGDGVGDVVTGSPLHDSGGRDAGRATIWSAATGARLWVLDGDVADDHLGWSVGIAGDVNGDGYADAVVGLPRGGNNGAETGRVQVFGRRPYDRQSEHLFLSPAGTPGMFGVDTQYVGDVNMDGIADYAIGAGQDGGLRGTVRVFSGSDSSVIHTFTGGAPSTWFGHSIGRAGDVDGDGHADVLTGSQHWTSKYLQEGRATLWSGRTGGIIQQWSAMQPTAHMGGALGGLGDIDNDGWGDVFIGLIKANNNTGAVRVYSGQTGQQIYEVPGSQQGDWFGRHGAQVGDINGDGFLDYAIGAPEVLVAPSTGPGYAVVLSGADGQLIWRFDGLFRDDKFGWAVAGPGDVDGDGLGDIVVGGHRHDPLGKIDAGMVRVFSGGTGQVLYHYDGEFSNDGFGQAVNGAGDVNGDGHADFLVGAPGADPGGVIGAGKAYLYSGADGSLIQTFVGASLLDGLGGSLAGLPDVSADGFADVVIGIPGDDTNGRQSGAAWVYRSQAKRDPGSFWEYGSACLGSNGKLPLIGFEGRPVVAQSFGVSVAGGLPSTLAVLGIDSASQQIGLGFLGAPSCTAWSLPVIAVQTATDRDGRSNLTINVPNMPALAGAQVFMQWILRDAKVAPLPFVFSNGGRVTFGQ